MKSWKESFLRFLAVLATFFTFLMLFMGVIVSKTGSGRGCGNSFPFCHGSVFPKYFYVKTIIEYSHRLVAAIGFFLILALVIALFILIKDKFLSLFSLLSIFFVFFQGVLGALTVVFQGEWRRNFFLALHFGFSLLAFTFMFLLTIFLFRKIEKKNLDFCPSSSFLNFYLWFLLIYSYLVIYTGALVRHSNATMGCGYNYIFCGKVFLPNFTTLAGIHLLHRYASFLLLFFVLLLVLYLKFYIRSKRIFKFSVICLLFLFLQILSGFLNIFSKGNLFSTLLHITLASLYFAFLSLLKADTFLKGESC